MSVPVSQNYNLSSEDKSISFELSAPCFINADKLIYQYRLIGFDERWISLNSSDRRINYTNLPYTHFQLELRTASTRDLLDIAPITVIKIYRNPPLWRRWYFISFVFILFLITGYLIIRGVTKRRINIEKRKAEIEQQLYKERERISRDLHDHLGTYAAAIKSNIVQLEKSEPKTNASIMQLKENAEDMVNALRETIWVMQYEQISMTSLSDRFKNLINRIAPNYPSVSFDIKEDIQTEKLLSPGVSIHLLRILQEILTNALKHSNCSRIEISIKVSNTISITIIDNGIGFNNINYASGYGLQNIQERAMESGLKVTIDSVLNVGTTVKITD
jgi:signal transduction histidine kinase